MVFPAFGWSTGDIAAAIRVLVTIGKAFKEIGGASTQYEDAVKYLNDLMLRRENLTEYAADLDNEKHSQIIINSLQAVEKPFSEFVEFLQRFEQSLVKQFSSNPLVKSAKKAQWAMKQLSGKFNKLKGAASTSLKELDTLLILQILENQLVQNSWSESQVKQLIDTIYTASIPKNLETRLSGLEGSATAQEAAAEEHKAELHGLSEKLSMLAATAFALRTDYLEGGHVLGALPQQHKLLASQTHKLSMAIGKLEEMGIALKITGTRKDDTEASIVSKTTDLQQQIRILELEVVEIAKTQTSSELKSNFGRMIMSALVVPCLVTTWIAIPGTRLDTPSSGNHHANFSFSSTESSTSTNWKEEFADFRDSQRDAEAAGTFFQQSQEIPIVSNIALKNANSIRLDRLKYLRDSSLANHKLQDPSRKIRSPLDQEKSNSSPIHPTPNQQPANSRKFPARMIRSDRRVTGGRHHSNYMGGGSGKMRLRKGGLFAHSEDNNYDSNDNNYDSDEYEGAKYVRFYIESSDDDGTKSPGFRNPVNPKAKLDIRRDRWETTSDWENVFLLGLPNGE